jgi:hypothetical protein
MSNPTEKLNFVDLKTLAWATSIAQSASPEFCLNVLCGYPKASG